MVDTVLLIRNMHKLDILKGIVLVNVYLKYGSIKLTNDWQQTVLQTTEESCLKLSFSLLDLGGLEEKNAHVSHVIDRSS